MTPVINAESQDARELPVDLAMNTSSLGAYVIGGYATPFQENGNIRKTV